MGEGMTDSAIGWARAHPLLLMLVLALVFRLVLMPFLVYDFDIYHWALIIENIQAGNGLYEVAGYYYTPVWGYILGAMTGILDLFGGLDVFGVRYTELLPVEDLICRFHIATITTLDFNIAMKALLVACDFAVAALIHRFTIDLTSDPRKALFATALWLFCLPVVYMSAIQAQFDTISALFTLLTVYLLYRDQSLLAGMMFSCTVLLKFFPAFMILVLVAYIWVKHRDDGRAVGMIVQAVLGAVVVFIVFYAPQIVDGNFLDSISFVTGRVGTSNTLGSIVKVAIMLVGTVVSGLVMLRSKGDLDRRLIQCCMVALVFVVLPSTTPQYPIVFIPLLAMVIADGFGAYMRPYIVMTVGAVLNALTVNNFSLLLSISEESSLVSPSWVVSAMQSLESVTLFGETIVTVSCAVAGVVQAIGTLFILMVFFRTRIERTVPRSRRLLDLIGGQYVER